MSVFFIFLFSFFIILFFTFFFSLLHHHRRHHHHHPHHLFFSRSRSLGTKWKISYPENVFQTDQKYLALIASESVVRDGQFRVTLATAVSEEVRQGNHEQREETYFILFLLFFFFGF